MTRRDVAKVFTVLMLFVLVGCSTNTDLGGTAIPNSRPDTRVTGQPPTLLEAGFSVGFNWTGNDPDGLIVGYQWKVSDNGLDGISPRDTLTVDPLTGAEIHPWHFTALTDSVFVVLADLEDFPNDPVGFERSFRTHTFFVRAMDEKGAVDPSPAQITFTSTTIVPTCKAVFPGVGEDESVAFMVPKTVNFSYKGVDEDFESGNPTHVRFLWTPAEIDNEGELLQVDSKWRYDQYIDLLIDFDDPNWTPWLEYAPLEVDRQMSFRDSPDGANYLFAVQVRDTAGALSIGKTYAKEVLNVNIVQNFFTPQIVANEYFLGDSYGDIYHNIPSGQPLNFSWTASAEQYNGNIESMRHGWDLADVDDVNDPGWAVPPGMAEQNRFAEERTFIDGNHTFWIRVIDDSGAVKVRRWEIIIIPFVSRENQKNLVFVDQVLDDNSGRWPNRSNSIFYDRQELRNEYWEFLARSGGVSGFTWESDFFDHSDGSFDYETLVSYKAALISARSHSGQPMFSQFRPAGAVDNFVWLTPYQKFGGNVFMVGSQSMESFLEVRSYMVPMAFESTVETYLLNEVNYVVGFGTKTLNDGTEILRGPLMYPFATVGISILDWNVPMGKNVYGRRPIASDDRTTKCSGLKEMRLIDDFRSNHLIGPGAIVDVIETNPDIDWRDDMSIAELDTNLGLEFPFTGDEFVNDMIAERPISIVIQSCEAGYQGMCIEPMFTGVTRMDWMRDKMWAEGYSDWPASSYSFNDLRLICGEMALTTYLGEDGTEVPLGTARANGKTYGYLSYKTVTDKPGGKADVYWGFDPYRFDHNETQKAILWVMTHFGLPLDTGK